MPYISLTKAELEKGAGDSDAENSEQKKHEKIFRHPVRSRILEILRDARSRTQQELGKMLSMSNAAIHYHVKLLLEVGIIKLHSTRPGPNGITEKLYTVDMENWPAVSDEDVRFYIDYTISWMNERNREGVNLLKAGDYSSPFLAGSYASCAPLAEVIQFKREVEKLFNAYFAKYENLKDESLIPFAATFSILPSRKEKTPQSQTDSRNILEFEPECFK